MRPRAKGQRPNWEKQTRKMTKWKSEKVNKTWKRLNFNFQSQFSFQISNFNFQFSNSVFICNFNFKFQIQVTINSRQRSELETYLPLCKIWLWDSLVPIIQHIQTRPFRIDCIFCERKHLCSQKNLYFYATRGFSNIDEFISIEFQTLHLPR